MQDDVSITKFCKAVEIYRQVFATNDEAFKKIHFEPAEDLTGKIKEILIKQAKDQKPAHVTPNAVVS